MKTKLKALFTLILMSLMVISLTSCDDDGYAYDAMYVSIATVNKSENGDIHHFTLDNGEKLLIVNSWTPYVPKNERVIINYTIIGENYNGYNYAIKLNNYVQDILTKDIVYIAPDDQAGQDEVGNNKVNIESIVAKGDYITVKFNYYMSDQNIVHSINMVSAENSLVQDSSNPIKLEFRHNNNGDKENYKSGFSRVCFRLQDYVKANENNKDLTFEVSWTDYTGTKQSLLLKYPSTTDTDILTE